MPRHPRPSTSLMSKPPAAPNILLETPPTAGSSSPQPAQIRRSDARSAVPVLVDGSDQLRHHHPRLLGLTDVRECPRHLNERFLMQGIAAELRRQQAGELTPSLDPGFTALALFAAAAPAILPHAARELTGLDPESEEFTRGYADHLARLVRRLRDHPACGPRNGQRCRQGSSISSCE